MTYSSIVRTPFLALLLGSLGVACGSADGATASVDSGTASGGDGDASGGGGGNTGDDGSAAGGNAGDDSGGAGAAEEGGDANDGGNDLGTGTVGSPGGVSLGTAGGFAILSKAGISTVPTSAVTGNIGVSPIDATAITGFSLTAAPGDVFSTSPQVTGKVYASSYTQPTPANLTTAIGDMQTAYTDAAGRAPTATGLGAGNIGGLTLHAGVYKWSSALQIPTNLTLAGSGTDVWIFQIAGTLSLSSATNVVLSGGAAAKNVYWQVADSVDLGTTSHFEGTILTKTAITMETGASITGRLLAQTRVSIQSSDVVAP
jgi:Ice-binding-like